jgi:DNA-binding beta-propeller fold protein YncE
MNARAFGYAAVALLCCANSAAAGDARVTARFSLGGAGGWDYPSVDAKAHRLYLARADRVQVVDTTTGKAVAEIADTPGVHGIALAPELGRGFISCGKANVVKVFDLRSNTVLASVPAGENPDAILFDPASKRVFAFNGRGHSATVIDARSNQVVATIALDGKPEFARADGRGGVFVNIEDKAQLAVLDARAATLKSYIALPGCDEPTGLAIDAQRRRAFAACGNKVLAVVDVDSGKSVASVPIGAGSDGAEFDAPTRTVFSANGEGSLSLIREVDADHFETLQTLATQRGARTLTLDEEGRKLFLPTAQFEPKPPGADAHARPQIVPETFVVLVVDIATAKSATH